MGDKMYVMLSGECTVSIPKTLETIDAEEKVYDEIKNATDLEAMVKSKTANTEEN